MPTEHDEFQSRLRVLLRLQGTVLTDEELSHTAECYPGAWGSSIGTCVSRPGAPGLARANTRVMRGSSIDAVYHNAERVRATAVGTTALNELESQEQSLEHPDH